MTFNFTALDILIAYLWFSVAAELITMLSNLLEAKYSRAILNGFVGFTLLWLLIVR